MKSAVLHDIWLFRLIELLFYDSMKSSFLGNGKSQNPLGYIETKQKLRIFQPKQNGNDR